MVLRSKWDWFVADFRDDVFIPVQDTVHIGAKIRARLLKRDRAVYLVFGNRVASLSDLEALRRVAGKDKHFLRESDLNPKDKMNYDAVERLCDPRLAELLKIYVPGIDTHPKKCSAS